MKTKTARHADRLRLITLLFSFGFTLFPADPARGAEDGVVDMIIELIRGSDNDMRMLALQQIREEIPGPAATLRFAALLPTLSSEVQVTLIDALGERGDAAARPAILTMLNSKTDTVRIKAVRALARLAGPADIPVLAQMAATGSDAEKEAARYSLRQLRGEEMNAALCAALTNADTRTKIELIAVLVDGDVKASVPVVLKSVDDPDLALRLAVLDALQTLADEHQVAAIVKRLKLAQDKSERKLASLALLATCKRAQGKCADAVIAGIEDTDAATCILMMRALPLAGGPKALHEIVTRLKDKDEDIRVEAVRILADWPDPTAIPHLKTLARDVKNLRNHVLAIRGLIHLARPDKNHPAADLATLAEAMTLATRKPEQVLVLGALGTIPTPESLALVVKSLDQPTLADDAGLAAVMIAEKIDKNNKDNKDCVRIVMQKVLNTVKNEKTRARTTKALEDLDARKQDPSDI